MNVFNFKSLNAKTTICSYIQPFSTTLLSYLGPLTFSIFISQRSSVVNRGQYSTIVSSVFLFSFIFSLAVPQLFVTLFHKGILTRSLLSTCWLALIAGEIIGGGCSILLLKIAGIPVTTFFFIAQIIATCSLGIQSANVTLMIQLKSKKFFVENSLISVVTTLITIGISEKFRLNYTNIFVVWVLGTFLVSFHGAFRIGRSFREKDLAKSAISLSKIKSYWKGSLKSWIVYINPFDSLRLDYFFILHFLGFEALGIYSVISSMLLVMPIMERIAVVRYGPYTNSRHGHNINHVIKKTTSELFILIVIPGILLLIFLHQTVSFVFGHQYNITLSEFLVLWIANAFYWNKRLIVDLVRSHQIDATLGVIELTTIIVTLIGLFAFHPRSIFSFAMVFLVSNTMSFTLTFTYVLKVFKKLPV